MAAATYDTLAETLVMFTKVNKGLLKRIEALESNTDTQPGKKKPEQVVEESKPVEIESFGRKAITQLSGKLGVQGTAEEKAPKEKKKSSLLNWLLSLLGLDGLAKGWQSFKDEIKKWFDDKISKFLNKNLQDLKKDLSKVLEDMKKLIGWVGEKFKGFGKWVAEKSSKLWSMLKDSSVGKSISGFFEKAKSWVVKMVESISNGAKSFTKYLLEKAVSIKNTIVDAGKNALETVMERTPGLKSAYNFGKTAIKKGANVIKKVAEPVVEAGGKAITAVGEGAVNLGKGALNIGGKVISKGSELFKFSKLFSKLRFSGKLFNSIIGKIPLLATLIQTFFTHREIQELVAKHNKDPQNYPLDMLFDEIGTKAAEGLGSLIGAEGGSTIAGILGSVVPGAGTVAGSFLGGMGGAYAGQYMGGLLGNMFKPQKKAVGQYLYNKFYENKQDIETDKIEDGIITKEGKVVQPHQDDTIYAMKDGGPFEKFFNANSKIATEGNTLIKNLTKMQNELLQKQIELMQSTNRLLNDLKDGISRPNNMISRPTSIVNNFGTEPSLRKLQGVNV